MDKEQALHSYFSGFGLTAYDENTVPDDAMAKNNGHYLTYSVSVSGFDHPQLMSVSLWYMSTSWAAITAKASEIFNALGEGGAIVPYLGGAAWFKRGTPFAQRMGDEDDAIRRIYINIEVEYLS